ncbi:uncharacterized protein LOC113777927 [Coffea eugenioides]|uniref:uncharacterized protein LOC113777927 n=1 Tax=Coffea eugenioides TaxID=49369 RepID=UPI000F60AB6E|nr:uncharacterized protein LOC113777927 [Coffea eugenioides]
MSTIIKKAGKQGKFRTCVTAVTRILTRARDFYINCMNNCASNVGTYNSIGGMVYPASHLAPSLPKSFSVRSSALISDDDLAELLRAASTGGLRNKIELEFLRQQRPPMGGVSVVQRSQTIAIGRIDEEKPCDFGEDVTLRTDAFPRSRSHAVTNRKDFLKNS